MTPIEWGRPAITSSIDSPVGNDAVSVDLGASGLSAEEEFGIPSGDSFLRTVLSRVRGMIAADSEIQIQQIIHGQYRESYFFVKGESRCRIDISYTGKSKLSSLQAPIVSELSTSIIGLLAPLKGSVIVVPAVNFPLERVLSKDFLKTFDAKLELLVTGLGARIETVREQEWSLRYWFSRDAHRAVFDFYYNRKGQMTRYAAVGSISTSSALVTEIESVLVNGFD